MLLENILINMQEHGENIVYKSEIEQYSYSELFVMVKQLYNYMEENNIVGRAICYGHKQIEMLATFIACSFRGVTYVPVDVSLPAQRLEYIINDVKPNIIFAVSKLDIGCKANIIDKEKLKQIFSKDVDNVKIKIKMKEDDIYYIIYTSGSTGNPKGVQVSYSNIDSFVNWFTNKINCSQTIILNQASFSFDLSVADIYLSLNTASCVAVLEKQVQQDYNKLFKLLETSEAEVAVMTPSFAEFLLVDNSFNNNLMKNLNTIYFCGETLRVETVEKLRERFNNVKIINSYGPTECTVAVTFIEVDYSMIENNVLPVGKIKEDCNITIVDSHLKEVNNNILGEILIIGKSVTEGYLNLKNDKRYIVYNGQKAYLTGDLGYIKNGLLYFKCRKDNQIKYNGYRIELEDITQNIYKLKYVDRAATVCKKDSSNKAISLMSFIKLKNKTVNETEIKKDLKELLPKYMCPKIKIVDEIDLNSNGKIDIKKLEEIVNGM